MKVWIIQTAEPIHIDKPGMRPMRAMNLADALVDSGHEVCIWTTGFLHSTKKHRTKRFVLETINNKLSIALIPSIGYKKNLGIRRVIDHIQLALNLRKRLRSSLDNPPDLVFIGYPPIETSFISLSIFLKRNIPTVIDVKDLWPTIFLEFFPVFLRPFFRILFSPYYVLAKITFRKATVLSAMSKEYIEWIYRFSGRKINNFDLITPLTSKIRKNSLDELLEAEKWWKQYGVEKTDIRRFCFVGYFNYMYDFNIIKEVAKRFKEKNIKCQFLLCGSGGEAYEQVKNSLRGLENVVFPGWIDSPKIEFLSQCCSGSIMPYRNIENFKLNITNKVSDSLHYGLPIITTLEGALKNLIQTYKVGYSCPKDNPEEFFRNIKLLLDNEELRNRLSKNAINLYKKKFDSEKVYSDLINALEQIANKKIN
tara:strand:+ start:1857 stop:3125 length:1269 start_codon:yes stop_codon:yes gene_type:complete